MQIEVGNFLVRTTQSPADTENPLMKGQLEDLQGKALQVVGITPECVKIKWGGSRPFSVAPGMINKKYLIKVPGTGGKKLGEGTAFIRTNAMSGNKEFDALLGETLLCRGVSPDNRVVLEAQSNDLSLPRRLVTDKLFDLLMEGR